MISSSQNILFFAYGEHMNEEEMKRDFPDARMVGLTYLPGYSLCFIGKDGRARAAIEPDPSGRAPGRVWSLSEEDTDKLDRIMDYPYFSRREIHEVTLDNIRLPVLVYVTVPGQVHGRPGFLTYNLLQEAYAAANENLQQLKGLAMKSMP